jgi:hypothetical protein
LNITPRFFADPGFPLETLGIVAELSPDRAWAIANFQAKCVASQCRFRTPTRENQAMTENAEPKYDTEAAD